MIGETREKKKGAAGVSPINIAVVCAKETFNSNTVEEQVEEVGAGKQWCMWWMSAVVYAQDNLSGGVC